MSRRKLQTKRVTNQGLNSSIHYLHAGELSLFDLPTLIRQSIDALKAKGIGRAELHHLIIAEGRLQLHINYFRALDNIGECVGMGYDAQIGHYSCFILRVNEAIDVAWLQKQGREL